MGNIFDEQKLYPHQGTIKGHFKDHYNSVFIALIPFVQLDRKETDKANLKKAKLLSHEEALKKIDFSETGSEGLLENKKAYVVSGSAGLFSVEGMEAQDFSTPYIKKFLGFIGITDVEVIRIEGTAIPGLQETAFQTAINSIEKAFRQIPA